MTLAQPAARAGYGKVLLFWCVSWACLAFVTVWLARSLDWTMVGASMNAADLRWIFGAFLANVCGLPLWIVAWRLLIPKPRQPGFATLFEAQSVTLAAIQTVSVLGGGAVAIFMLVRRAGLSASGAVSLLTFDQLLTGLVKVIIIATAVAFAPAPPLMRTTALSLLAVVVSFLGVVLLVAHSEGATRRRAIARGGVLGKAFHLASELAGHLSAIRDPSRFAAALGLYLLRRSMEGFAAICVQVACGVAVSPEAALLVVAALSIATIVPGPPGNLGVYEAAVVIAYLACGVSSETAIAMALLQHVAFLAGAVLPGAITLATRQPWKRRLTSP